MLIALAGLPGTGKTRVGRALADRLGGIILDKDAVRAALFPPQEIEYSTEQDDFCVSIMLEVAAYLFGKNREHTVLLDGRPFVRRYQRDQVTAFAQGRGIALCWVECVCPDEVARARIERDVADEAHAARNRDYALYSKLKAESEPIGPPKLLLRTERSLDACVDECLAYLHGLLSI